MSEQYGVTTQEISRNGYDVIVVDARLNIGATSIVDRRACDHADLNKAADKLNVFDELLAALEVAEKRLSGLMMFHSGDLAAAIYKDQMQARTAIAKAKGC